MSERGFKWLCLALILSASLFASIGSAAQTESGRPWDGSPAPIAGIEILIHNPFPGGLDWNALARALIQLNPGDTLNTDRLEQAESALAPLAQVRTQVVVRPGGLLLTFQVSPYGRIKTIEIDGNYPLLEKEVRNAMTVVSGDVFREADMPKQERLVAQLFRAQGYLDPRVHIAWKRNTSDGTYQLTVQIHKGPYYTLEDVRFHGNRSISALALKFRMSTWRWNLLSLGTSRFRKKEFDKDVRRLIDYYRSRRFADAVIESTISTHGPEKRLVVADLNIREGPLYRIHFSGNVYFSDRRLRQDLVLFKTGNRGNIGLRRSIYKIRRRYMQAGFADVQVHWRESTVDGPPAVREVAINIEEGRRRIIDQVTIEGNHQIDDATIRGQMLSRPPGILKQGAYVPEVLSEDLTAIEALYRNRGFLNARVNDRVTIDPKTAKVRVTVIIAEGPRTTVGQVVLKGKPPVAEKLLRKGLRLKPGQPYVPFTLRDDEDTLASRISPHGYPYVKVQGEAQLTADRTKADIDYTIVPGPHVRVGQIFFVGNFDTRVRFMRRELGFKTGDSFSLKEVLEAQRRLRNLNIFESVQVHSIGLKERQDKVHLLVRTVEKKPYYFLAGGGYQTDKGFYGRTQIGDYNFTGTAKDLSLSAQLSQVGYRTDIGLGEPRFFGTSIRANSALFVERSEPFNQDFGTDTYGASITFSRSWKHHISTGLGLRYERREQFIRERTAVTAQTDPSAFEPRSVVVTTPSVLYDSRDSFIRPHRGQWISATVDISNGLDNALDDFLKYRIEARAYHTVLPPVTLAGRAWAGYLEPTGGAQPPLDQLFFLGGTTTVRGFKENLLRYDAEGNPIGGRLALLASLEARIDVGYNFQVVPFVDTGSVRDTLIEAGSDAFRWSAGLGLQYITPIGPIGLFYGYKLNRRPGESAGAWHLSVGYTF